MAEPGRPRQRVGEAPHRERGSHALANLEAAERRPPRDGAVPDCHIEAASGRPKAQKLLHQMAAGEAEIAFAGDDRAEDYATASGVLEGRG